MRAEAVLYVGDLARMREFYERCFGLSLEDEGPGFCGLASEAWLLTLVHSEQAVPSASPAPRRGDTPVKLAFCVPDIDGLLRLVADLGGRVGQAESTWEFRGAAHLDCVDPEGNVVQLVQPNLG